jgi:hypothetical protein
MAKANAAHLLLLLLLVVALVAAGELLLDLLLDPLLPPSSHPIVLRLQIGQQLAVYMFHYSDHEYERFVHFVTNFNHIKF